MNPDIYIAGPIRGIEDGNKPAFAKAEADLVVAHFVPFNPATHEVAGWGWADYLAFDIPKLIECGRIFTLPGWRASQGASLEMHVAMQLEFPWYQYDEEGRVYKVRNESALHEAHDLVYGGRGQDYGHPFSDYTKTAAIWQVIFGSKLTKGTHITAEEVILSMVAVKMSRELNRPKRDNRVDGAGYFECLERCHWLTEEQKTQMKQELGL